MNINSMIMKINNFNRYIVDSGFHRDINEFLKTISQPQNNQNIVLLKDITKQVMLQLQTIMDSDLPDDLIKLLPQEHIKLFSVSQHIEDFKKLVEDTEVDTTQYYSRLNDILSKIQAELNKNQAEIKALHDVLLPYYEKCRELADKAVISFIFKDSETISNLKRFAKVLERWNRTLHIYSQLISSKPPEDVELVNIQNGTLDVVLNINIDIAVKLTEIIKYGLIAFSGYLAYKRTLSEIVATYCGNKKLIKFEREREELLLNNIGETIEKKLTEQHKLLARKDKKINSEAIPKKIEEVSKVLSEHIVKGNDIKLLVDYSVEDNEEDTDSENEKNRALLEETEKVSLTVRNHLKRLTSDETKLLIDKYTICEEDKGEGESKDIGKRQRQKAKTKGKGKGGT